MSVQSQDRLAACSLRGLRTRCLALPSLTFYLQALPVLCSPQPLILVVQAQHDLHCLCSLTEETVSRGLLTGVGTALRDALAFGKDGLQLSLAGESGLSITVKAT